MVPNQSATLRPDLSASRAGLPAAKVSMCKQTERFVCFKALEDAV